MVVVLVLLDAGAMTAATAAGQLVGFGDLWPASGFSSQVVGVVAAIVAAWVFTVATTGGYDPNNLGAGSEEFRRMLDAAVRLLAITAAAAFALGYDEGRGFVLIALPLGTALALTGRYTARRWLHHQRARGRFVRRVLVVATERGARELCERLQSVPTGMAIAGACVPEQAVRCLEPSGVPVVGPPEDAVRWAREVGVDVVVVADTTAHGSTFLRRLAWQLEGTGIDLMVAPGLVDVAGPRIAVRPAADVPLLHLAAPEFRGWRRFLKGAIDRVAATVAFVALLPVMVVVSAVILVAEGRPVFFRQWRVGRRGTPFLIWKFRTMTTDAESLLSDLRPHSDVNGPLFKMRNDPRVTRVGRILRRWSLDELPQLLNVIKGEMSLVGPRPPLPCEVETYSPDVRRRLLVKPGITGLWQVSGRSGLTWEESVRIDLYYVENWSPSLDAMIMARTVIAVFRAHGAC